jgi:uncharacterized membrane protein YbhN (UPF0104 family)
MKNGFRYIFYASLIFLVVALIRADYLVVPTIYNYTKLILSLLLLFLGFVLSAVSWARMVHQADYHISFSDGITSLGLSIFAKYIPGKVWVIMGRAEYLAKKYNFPRKDMGSLSLDAQLLALWVALMLGTIGMISIKSISLYGLSVLILFIILNLFIFTPLLHRVTGKILTRLLKREISFPRLSFRKLLGIILWYGMNWGTWCLSFYFLAGSLVEGSVPFSVAFAFGLAGSIGIIAVFAPGGLGVREGILTGFLTLAGMDLPMATTIGITSRLWFLAGELFIFLFAAVLRSKNKPTE